MMHRYGWAGPKARSNTCFAWFIWQYGRPPEPLGWFDWQEIVNRIATEGARPKIEREYNSGACFGRSTTAFAKCGAHAADSLAPPAGCRNRNP